MILEGFRILKFICLFITIFIFVTSTIRCIRFKANDNEVAAGIMMIPLFFFIAWVEV